MGCCKTKEINNHDLVTCKIVLELKTRQIIPCKGDLEEPVLTAIKTISDLNLSSAILPEISNEASIASWKFFSEVMK